MVRSIWDFLVQVFGDWLEVKAPRLGAALAYYSVFSLAPLVIIALGVAGMVLDRETARVGMVQEFRSTLGDSTAKALDEIITNMQQHGHSPWAAFVGVIALLFGASGVFVQLQDALNTIWRVKPRPDWTIGSMISERFFSFAVVLGIGFLLVVSLIASAVLSALGAWFAHALPGGATLWQIVNAFISWVSITFFFGLVFKLLPDVDLKWRHVWLGAALTSFLFTLGKSVIGMYLARSGAASAFGAAASLVVILVWVYYSAQILLFGAAFTRAFALREATAIRPSPHAVPVSNRERANQGLTA